MTPGRILPLRNNSVYLAAPGNVTPPRSDARRWIAAADDSAPPAATASCDSSTTGDEGASVAHLVVSGAEHELAPFVVPPQRFFGVVHGCADGGGASTPTSSRPRSLGGTGPLGVLLGKDVKHEDH